jgi:hypothetical protein
MKLRKKKPKQDPARHKAYRDKVNANRKFKDKKELERVE